MKMSPIEPPGRGDFAVTSASRFLRTGRGAQTGDLSEQAFWKDALKREDAGNANLLTNMLGGDSSGMSYLKSSTAGGGEPWLAVGPRNSQMTMVLRRLKTEGQLAGPLQLSASQGSLPLPSSSSRSNLGQAALPPFAVPRYDPTAIPDDFLPQSRPTTSQSRRPESRQSRTFSEMVAEEEQQKAAAAAAVSYRGTGHSPLRSYQSTYSSASLFNDSSASLGGSIGGSRRRLGTPSGGGGGAEPGMKRSGSILALGSTGVQLARPSTGNVSLADFDARRPRPKPLITDTEGFGTSSHYLSRHGGYCAAPFRATWR